MSERLRNVCSFTVLTLLAYTVRNRYRYECIPLCMVRPHFRFGSEIWNWSENFASLLIIDLNFALLCFASKQKLLNRSEAKNLKRKNEKMRKNAKNSEKKVKKVKKSEKIDLNFASLCFASKRKLLKWSEAKNLKQKEEKRSEKREVKFYSEIVKHMWNGSKFALFRL